MPRNAEVIRQWNILREIERSRTSGVSIDELASQCGVTTRTIRRDLQALEEAGFPIYDDRSRDDGRTRWIINGQAFKGLAAGLTLSELCALYFSRSLVESLSGTPFRDDVDSAFEKLTGALTPHMQRFLDQLPRVLSAKSQPQAIAGSSRRTQIEARALEATLGQRQASITYFSKSSDRTKTYLVHPIVWPTPRGALYLLGYVPEYRGATLLSIGFPSCHRSRRRSRRSRICQTRRFLTRWACTRVRRNASRSSSSRRSGYERARTGIHHRRVRDAESGGVAMTLGRVPRSRARELDPQLRSLLPASSRPRASFRSSLPNSTKPRAQYEK
jgi:hypothetical protein